MDNETQKKREISSMFDMALKLKEKASNAASSHVEKEKSVAVIEEKIEAIKSGTDVSTVMSTADIVLQSGKPITSSKYLKSLGINHRRYATQEYTPEEALLVKESIEMQASGVASAVPMMCTGDACAFKRTCLTGDTMILMHDGTQKEIKNIKRNDIVLSYNTNTGRIQKDMVTRKTVPVKKETYIIETDFGHIIECTDDHPFYASIDGFESYEWVGIVDGLMVGSKILFTDCVYNEKFEMNCESVDSQDELFVGTITNITGTGEEKDVYDLLVIANHNFFANGVLVHNCPLYEIGKAPVDEKCLVEASLLEYWATKYFEEFDVDPTRLTEMNLVAELAELDIYEMRATKVIAEKTPTMVEDQFMGFDNSGNRIMVEDISKYFDLKERLKRNRVKILEALMATRKERSKVAIKVADLAGQNATISDIKAKLEMIGKDISKLNKNKEPEEIIEDVSFVTIERSKDVQTQD